MFTNNTSKAGAMSAQTSQEGPLNTPRLNDHHKRRRSQELSQPERSVLRPGADSSNGQGYSALKRDEKRCLSNTTDSDKENRAHGGKRQRTSGAFNPVHDNGIRLFDQEEARQQPARTTGSSSTDPVLPEQDRLRVGIAALPLVLFGAVSSRPNVLQSCKLDRHLATVQSPLVPQDPKSPPFTSYKSLGGGFASLSNGNEHFLKKFVNTREELFRRPAVDTVKQTPLAHTPRRKKAVEVWKDVSQSSDRKDRRPTALGSLHNLTNSQKDEVASGQKSFETGQELAVAVRRRRKRMRVEEGEHHHPNLKDFKFSIKRKAEGDLREGSAKKIKMLRDQPFPPVGNGESQSAQVQEFTSEYFTEDAKPLPSDALEDVLNAAALDQKDPKVHEGLYSLVEAQQVPVAESEPILNGESSPPETDSEILSRPFQEPEHDGLVSSSATVASPDLQAIVNEPSQGQESSAGDETAFREFNNHRTPPLATEVVITPEVASIIIPIVPSWIAETSRYSIGIDMAYSEGYNPENPENYEHYIAQFTARPAFSREREYEYRPMPEMLDVEILNQRLNWAVPDDGEPPRLFRELPVPQPYIDSELARCVRFAQSDSQKRVDWRAHPNHVAEIIQRTNFYGMELLISRGYMGISSPPTKDEFELAMATRLAHASFGKDPVAYIAADVRALADYLMEDIPSAMCLIMNEEKDHFGDFSKYYRVKFEERYPPFSDVGLPTWQLLLDGERGQPSLKTQSLRYIIDSIKEQIAQTQALSDGGGLQPLGDEISYEDAQPGNKNVNSYHSYPDQDHNLDGGNLDGDFGWTIGEFNLDISNVDCIRTWEEYSASPAFQSNDEGVARTYPDPIHAGAAGGALEPMADFYSPDVFWTNQNSSAPWNSEQDVSVPVMNVVPSEAPAAESFFSQKTGTPFDNETETDEWL